MIPGSKGLGCDTCGFYLYNKWNINASAMPTSATSRMIIGFCGFFTLMSLINSTPTTTTATLITKRKYLPQYFLHRYRKGKMIAMDVMGSP